MHRNNPPIKNTRCSLFTIEPEKQKEFIEQSDSFKRSQKRLQEEFCQAYMIQTERDKILLVGEYTRWKCREGKMWQMRFSKMDASSYPHRYEQKKYRLFMK